MVAEDGDGSVTPRETMRLLPGGMDTATGEMPADALSYGELELKVKKLQDQLGSTLMKVGKLEAQEAREEEAKAGAGDIRAVLEHWRPLCMPKASIVANSPRWKKVSERLKDRDEGTGDKAFSVDDLKDATKGALLSKFHRDGGYLDAETIFRDSGTVDKHLKRYLAWLLTPQSFEHDFAKAQKWLRQNGAEGFADALLGDRLEETLVIERAA